MSDNEKIVKGSEAYIKKRSERTSRADLTAAEKKQTRKKRIRKILLFLVFVAINVTVIVATAVNEFGNSRQAAQLSEIKINWWLLIPATLCFVVAFVLDIYKYVLMLRKNTPAGTFRKGEDWKLARRTVIFGRYYDNITPAAVGGQPFQIYYMHKSGKLKSGLATTIPMMGMISIQIGFILVALVCFLFGGIRGDSAVLGVAAWLGLLFYAFWPVAVMLATFFPKVTAKIINAVVKLLSRMRIVKNRDEVIAKIEHEVGEYAASVKRILKSKGLFATIILISVVYNVLMAMIPFFVLTAFGGNVDLWQTLATTVAVMSSVYFVPTPGNSGAAEGTFYMVFSALSDGFVFWAMLIWRFFSYYIYILMGPITYAIIKWEEKRKMREGILDEKASGGETSGEEDSLKKSGKSKSAEKK